MPFLEKAAIAERLRADNQLLKSSKQVKRKSDLVDLKLARKRLSDLEKGRDKILGAEKVWKTLRIRP